MTLLDTSILVDALGGGRRTFPKLVSLAERGDRLVVSSIVAYEWLRGPRTAQELADQEALFPVASAIPFEAKDAEIAARLYKSVRKARTREVDLAIAACAIRHDAELWTLNKADFSDVPGLKLLHA